MKAGLKFTGAAFVALIPALTACSSLPDLHGISGRSAAVSLRMPDAPQRSIQQVVSIIDSAAIATMDIVPYLRNGGTVYEPISASTGLPTTLGDPAVLKVSEDPVDFTRTVTFGNLRQNAFYRFEVRAYGSDGSLLSDPASSSILLQVGLNDRPVLAQLKLKLLDTTFAATSSITLLLGNSAAVYDHVLLEIGKVSGVPEVFAALSSCSLTIFGGLITMSNLTANTRYRTRATAFAGQDNSSPVALATCDVAVMNDDQPATASITLFNP